MDDPCKSNFRERISRLYGYASIICFVIALGPHELATLIEKNRLIEGNNKFRDRRKEPCKLKGNNARCLDARKKCAALFVKLRGEIY